MKKRRRRLTNRILAFVMAFSLIAVTFYSDYAVAFADELPASEQQVQEDNEKDVVAEEEQQDEELDEDEYEEEQPDAQEQDEEEEEEPLDEQPADEEDEEEEPVNEQDEEEQPANDQDEEEQSAEEQEEDEQLAAEEDEEVEEAEDGEVLLSISLRAVADEEAADALLTELEEAEAVTYTVSYYADGELIGTQTYTEGENDTLSLLDAPDKDGYRFMGWGVSDGMTVTGDMTLTADYEAITYDVTYYVDGSWYGSQTYTAADNVLSLIPAPGKTGYSFLGWGAENGDIVSADMRLDAMYEAAEYTVIYNVDGSEYIRQSYGGPDVILSLPEAPFKAGYIFEGWFAGETQLADGDTIFDDITVSAAFAPIRIYDAEVRYYYVYNGNKFPLGSTNIRFERSRLPVEIASPDSAVVGEVPDTPTYYPTKSKVTVTEADLANLTGQYEEGAVTIGVITPFEVEFVPTDINYTAEYLLKDLNAETYSVVYTDVINATKGATVTPPLRTVPGGEYETADVKELTEEGMTLRVYYTRKNYTLSFDVQEGTYVDSVYAPYGTEISTAIVPKKTGYDFAGWYKDPSYNTPAPATVTLLENTTLYAKWEAAEVRVTVIYQIENADDNNYSFLDTVEATATAGIYLYIDKEWSDDCAPASLDKVHFTYKEGSDNVYVKPDGTTILTAKYSRNKYTITWNGERYNTSNERVGGKNKYYGSATITAKYGATITAEWKQKFNDPWQEYSWSYTVNNDMKFVSIDLMPGENKRVYQFQNSSTKTQYQRFWLENYTGTGVTTKVRNGITYGLFKTDVSHFNYMVESSEYKDMEGYTKAGATFGKTENAENYSYSWGSSAPTTMYANFYYNAKSYPLTFFNSNNDQIVSYSVKYNASLNSYLANANSAAASHKPVADAQFAGWYEDLGGGTPNSYTKMPTGLSLYAKWILPERTITYVDGFTGTNVTLSSQTKTYGETADTYNPTVTHQGYTFVGWFEDAACTDQYDEAKPLTENITVYAKWNQKMLQYTVKYVDEEGLALASPKTVMNQTLTIGQTITEKAIQISGRLPDESEKTIELAYEGNEIIFVYSLKPQTITYEVRYVIRAEDGTESLHSSVERTVPGTTVSVTEAAINIGEGYYPTVNTIEQELTAGENMITFIYLPYRTGTVIIHYVDMDGNTIKGDEIATGCKPGTTYTIQTAVNGYTYNRTVDGNGKGAATRITVREGENVRYVYYQKDLIITAENKSKVYDGEALVSAGLEDLMSVEGLAAGHSLTDISYTGSQLDVGSSKTYPENAVISGASANYYRVIYRSANLTVTKAVVNIVIAGQTASVPYDGQTHEIGYEVTSITEGYNAEDLLDISDETTTSGKDAGTYPLNLTGKFTVKQELVDNYVITLHVTNGKLEINPVTLKVITQSADKPYDGTALTAPGSITGFVNGESAAFTVTGSQTEVGTSANTYELNFEGATAKAGNYLINESIGTLEVTANADPVVVTVKGKTAKNTYDGAAHSVSGYDVEIDNDLYSEADIVFNGTAFAERTEYGKTNMGLSKANFSNGNPAFTNVTFNVTDGYQEITKRDVTVTIEGKQASKTYDGASHSVTGYDVKSISDALYTEADFTLIGEAKAERINKGTTNMGLDASKFENNNDNFKVTFSVTDGYQEIKAATAVVTITGHFNTATYDGNEHKVTGYEVESSNSLYTAADFTFSGTDEAVRTDYGKTDMGLAEDQFENTNANFEGVTFNVTDGYQAISKASVVVTIVGNHEASITYDGKAHEVTGYEVTDISNPLYTEDDFTFNGNDAVSRIDVGTDYMGLAADQFVNNNENFDSVEFAVTDGYVSIIPLYVVFTVPDAEKKYDGTSFTAATYQEYLAAHDLKVGYQGLTEGLTVQGNTATIAIPGGMIDAGSYANVVTVSTDTVITKADGSAVTYAIIEEGQTAPADANIILTVEKGSLTITKRDVTLTSPTAERAYNGKALTATEIEVSGDGFVQGEGAIYDVTGTQTLPGSSENAFTYALQQNTKAGNYNINTMIGTLTVTASAIPLTITSGSKDFTYDGAAHMLNEYTVNGTLMPGDYLVVNITGSIREVSENAEGNNVMESIKVYHGSNTATAGADSTKLFSIVAYAAEGDPEVTGCYNITSVNGTLRIVAATLTVKANDAAKDYDGKVVTAEDILTVDGITYTAEGLIDGHTLEAEAAVEENLTVSKDGATYIVHENEGNTSVVIKDAEGNRVANSNYSIIYLPGNVVVNKGEGFNLYLVANSATYTYTGAPLSVEGYIWNTDNEEIEELTINNVSAGRTETEIGSYTVTFAYEDEKEDVRLIDSFGNDVTPYYDIHYTNGILFIAAPANEGGIDSTPDYRDEDEDEGEEEGGSVLGASRGIEATTENDPVEGEVLGAGRGKSPKTSDTSNAVLWALVMGSSSLGLAALMTKKRREDQE